MVRVSGILAGLAAGASMVQALPAQAPYEKRAEPAPPQPTATAAAKTGMNKDAAYAGAAMLGAFGAILGATIGAYMPPDTTFTVNSILKGLESEISGVSAYADTLKAPSSLGLLESLMPSLGGFLNSHPGVQPGTPYTGPDIALGPPPTWESAAAPTAPAAAPTASVPAPSAPVAAPAAPKAVAPPAPVAPALPLISAPATPTLNSAPLVPSNQAQRGPKVTPAAPSTPAMPEMAGMAGMSHGARR